MGPVWLVHGRQLAASLRYWLAAVGYDKNDKSLSHKIYLGYAAIFFALWGFAVLSLMAGAGARLLRQFNQPSISLTAAALTGLLLLGWSLWQAWSAARRSPLVFNEDDAYLICQTPVSRRAVAFAWLSGAWAVQVLLLGAVSVVLAFSTVEGSLVTVSITDAPRYLLAGMEALLVVALLCGGSLALAWALGCLRLGGKDALAQHPFGAPGRLYLLPLGLGGFLAIGLLVSGSPLAGLWLPPWNFLLAPLTFPAAAAFGLQSWGLGMLVAALWALLGLAALWYASPAINLSQAAQETAFTAALQAATLSGASGAAEQIQLERRLGIGVASGRLPLPGLARPGALALLWKHAVASGRRGLWNFISAWLLIFFVGLGAALAPDWGSRAWALLLWSTLICQRAAAFTQTDLAQWALLRGLPLSARRILLAGAALPAALAAVLAWLALLGSSLVPGSQLPAFSALFIPPLVLAFALAGAVDVLRTAHTHHLLAGSPPSAGGVSLAISAAILAAVILGMGWLAGQGLPPVLWVLSGLLLACAAAWILLEVASHLLRSVD